jgi:hypothetical protein
VGLERGPLSLVCTTEELLGRKSNGSGLENREYCRRDSSCCPRDTLYPQKLALTSPTSGGRSVGIARSRTEATEFFYIMLCVRNFAIQELRSECHLNILPCCGHGTRAICFTSQAQFVTCSVGDRQSFNRSI